MHDKITNYIENKKGNNFRQTEIGLIPMNWEAIRLEEVAEVKSGGNAPQGEKYFLKGKYPFIRVQHFDGTSDYVKKWDLINDLAVSDYNLKLFPKDSIVFPKSGASIRLEKRAILPFDCYVVSHLCVLIPKKDLVENKFLFYLLKILKFSQDSSGTTLPYLNLSSVSNHSIPLPSLPEQKKISGVLSKIQQAIEQQDRIVEATKNLKKSLMQKLFTEGVINGFMFDTNIFNHILDNKILIENFPEYLNLFITHIQLDELEKTRDQNRRKMLLTIFKKIDQENIPTESLVLSVSKLGKAKLGDENGLYKKIKLDLDEKEIKQNNKQDALIAKTTIKNGLILVTDDSDLLEVTQKYNGEVITLKDFLSGNYRKLKETEIGQIPEGWDVVRLGYIAEFKNGINFTKDQKGKKGILTIAVLNMYGNGIYVKLNNLYRVDKEIDSDYMLNGGDILFVRSSLKREGVGWTSLYKEIHEQVTFCGFIIRARLKYEGVSPEYLTNYLRTDIARNSLISSSGKVSITNINQGMLGRTPVPLPSLPEQQKIAHILSIMDQKIEVEESRKSILKELFKTMLHKLITGEIRLKDIEV